MRILTVGNLYPPQHLGGYELMWQATVRALRTQGHEVSVLTTDTRLRDVYEFEPGISRSLRWYWRDHRWPRMAPWTARAIEQHNREVFAAACEGVDLVSFWAMGGLSLSLLSLVPVPSLAAVHDAWPDYGPKVDKAFRGRLELPPAVWVSEHLRGGRPGEVVSSGYDETVFVPIDPPSEWSGRLLLPGRIDVRKGHRTAVYALGGGFVVAGAGDPEATLALKRAGVELLGQLEPVALHGEYARGDAVLFPVEWDEPWGLVPLEAMAVGRPVVATGRGGSGEYLRHEENCLLFEAGDSAGLRAAVERLAGDPALRERLRQGGFATAREHTLSRFVERMVAAHEAYASRR